MTNRAEALKNKFQTESRNGSEATVLPYVSPSSLHHSVAPAVIESVNNLLANERVKSSIKKLREKS